MANVEPRKLPELQPGDVIHLIVRDVTRRNNVLVDVTFAPERSRVVSIGADVAQILGFPYVYSKSGMYAASRSTFERLLLETLSRRLFGAPHKLSIVWL